MEITLKDAGRSKTLTTFDSRDACSWNSKLNQPLYAAVTYFNSRFTTLHGRAILLRKM